jgi:hypothetical protein
MYNWDYLYADLNLSIDFQEKFWFGLGVNNMWQAGFNAGAKVGEDVNVGYSFKFPNGQQRGLLGPLHEFTASIGFGLLEVVLEAETTMMETDMVQITIMMVNLKMEVQNLTKK